MLLPWINLIRIFERLETAEKFGFLCRFVFFLRIRKKIVSESTVLRIIVAGLSKLHVVRNYTTYSSLWQILENSVNRSLLEVSSCNFFLNFCRRLEENLVKFARQSLEITRPPFSKFLQTPSKEKLVNFAQQSLEETTLPPFSKFSKDTPKKN